MANEEQIKPVDWAKSHGIKVDVVMKLLRDAGVAVRTQVSKLDAKDYEKIEADAAAYEVRAKAEAEAEANRLKVAAGLTPQERAEWDYKTKVGVAEAISKVNLPQIVSTGGNGNSNAMDAIGLKMLIEMSEKLSK